MKKLIISVVFMSIAALLILSTVRADLILSPTDDAYVNLNDADTNFNESGLIVDYTNNPCVTSQRTHLRFNLSSLPGDVGSTTQLRLYIVFPPALASGTLALWSTGDDWNLAEAGLGSEDTLTYNNAPVLITELDTKASSMDVGWVEFTGEALSNYINAERSGDNVASFAIVWDNCPSDTDLLVFEDSENTLQSDNEPELYPFSPTAITLAAFSTSSHVNSPWMLILGVGLLVVIITAGIILRRRSKIYV